MIQIWPKNNLMIYFNKNHLKFCKTYGMKQIIPTFLNLFNTPKIKRKKNNFMKIKKIRNLSLSYKLLIQLFKKIFQFIERKFLWNSCALNKNILQSMTIKIKQNLNACFLKKTCLKMKIFWKMIINSFNQKQHDNLFNKQLM